MDWNLTKVNKFEYCHALSMITVKNDCETLKELVPVLSQPIIALLVLPYYALFCTSLNEYFRSQGQDINFINNSPFEFSDVRNTLKLFDEKYGKAEKLIYDIDNIQDQEFKNKLRWPFLSKLNLYHNLGVFFLEDKYIIGNTQYMYYIFQNSKILNKSLYSESIRELGKSLGTVINSVSKGLGNFMPQFHIDIVNKSYLINSKDFNTNKKFNIFPQYKNGKELSLMLLHILGSVNFVRYILSDLMSDKNIWLLRVKYITMYYANKKLKKILEKIPDFPIKELLNKTDELFDTEFRSCMMHYSFINKDNFIISDKYLNLYSPFFGLIESRFNGMSYDELNLKIDKKIIEISDVLTSIVKFDV